MATEMWYLYLLSEADSLREWQKLDTFRGAFPNEAEKAQVWLRNEMMKHLPDFDWLLKEETWYVTPIPEYSGYAYIFGVGWYKGMAAFASPYRLTWLDNNEGLHSKGIVTRNV